MKYFIMSDIHGSAVCCEKALEQFSSLKCDEIILLGDILYHGPRNSLPEEYNPKKVTELLNPLAGKIIACRGNCDSEVDQMVLDFPIMADYSFVVDEGKRIFCTHGHIYSPERAEGQIAVPGSMIPKIKDRAVVFYGHTHIQVLEKNRAGIVVCNPGSVSLPKNESKAGFAVYENSKVTLFELSGKEISSLSL